MTRAERRRAAREGIASPVGSSGPNRHERRAARAMIGRRKVSKRELASIHRRAYASASRLVRRLKRMADVAA